MLNEVAEGARFTSSYGDRVKCPAALPLLVIRTLSLVVLFTFLRFVQNQMLCKGEFLHDFDG